MPNGWQAKIPSVTQELEIVIHLGEDPQTPLIETLGPMFGFPVPIISKLCPAGGLGLGGPRPKLCPAGGLGGPRPPFPIILPSAARYDLCVAKKTHSNQFSELGMSETV